MSRVVFARSHVSFVGSVTSLDSDFFEDSNLELDIGLHRPMASGAF